MVCQQDIVACQISTQHVYVMFSVSVLCNMSEVCSECQHSTCVTYQAHLDCEAPVVLIVVCQQNVVACQITMQYVCFVQCVCAVQKVSIVQYV